MTKVFTSSLWSLESCWKPTDTFNTMTKTVWCNIYSGTVISMGDALCLCPPALQAEMRSQCRGRWWGWVWVVVGLSLEAEQRCSGVFDVTAGDCKNEGWHRAAASSAPAGHPASTVSQSLSQIPALFTLVLLTCVRVCVCVCVCVRARVYPQATDLGEVTAWRGPLSVAQ